MPRKNSSQAYDLSLFETKKAKVIQLKPNKKMEKARKRKNAFQSLLSTLSVLAVAVVIISVMGAMINSRVQLTEIQGEIKSVEKQIMELESEKVRLTDELARTSSAQNVEEYARDVLGMQKVDPSQITYIQTGPTDKAELPEPEPPTFFQKVTNFFSGLPSKIKSWFEK